MIEIKDKKDCCGCHACVSICAKHCITMQADEEGFLYPIVDKDVCTDCGLCEKVCPVINQSEPRKPLKVYAAKNKDEEIRRQSSSGGIFTLLAEKVINEGGVVFGARFDEDWNVIHAWTDTIEGIAAFRGSKYVQSMIGDTYREAREFLKQGRKVLFSGTPCQIAGLKKYLRKEYDNLLTVDVVCHGVPSPLVWRRYLDETREQLRAQRGVGKNSVSSSIDELPVITGISFRDKTHGWKKFGFRLRYAASKAAQNTVSAPLYKEEKDWLESFTENVFMRGFLANLYLRPSCYACAARSGKSGSDISLADYWGVKAYHPGFADDKGISLLLINTLEGERIYAKTNKEDIATQYEYGLGTNPCIEISVKQPGNRNAFWKEYSHSGIGIIGNYIAPSTSTVRKIFIKVINRIKRILK